MHGRAASPHRWGEITSRVIAMRGAAGDDALAGPPPVSTEPDDMQPITPLMRKALLADALLSGATAILLLVGARPLESLLAIPAGFLFRAGLVLAAFVAFVLVLSRCKAAPRILLLDVVLINALWVLASVAVLAAGVLTPNTLGTLFVLVQAFAVAVFATVQTLALRRTRLAAA